MQYVIEFMFYAISVIAITIPVAGIIAYNMDDKKVSLMDWIKNF